MPVQNLIATDSYMDVALGRSQGRFEDMWFSRKGILDEPPQDVSDRCVLYYHSLDCNLSGQDHCRKPGDGFEPVRELPFKGRPYGDYLKARCNDDFVPGVYRQKD